MKWQTGYCLYYSIFEGERECFRTLGSAIEWLESHADEFLGEGAITIRLETFDEELWEEIDN